MAKNEKNSKLSKPGTVSWKNEIHEAAAAKSKIASFTVTMKSLREMAEKEAKLVQCALRDMENNLIDPKYILELTKSIHDSEEKSITDYINQNTEILLNEHASVVRQQVIENMKLQIRAMTEEITSDAKRLEQDISNFLELIQSSYMTASNSFKRVVQLAKKNYEKAELINETSDTLFSLKSEIENLEQHLLECLMCTAFLCEIFPEEYDKKKCPSFPEEFLRSFGPTYSPEEKISMQKNVLKDILDTEKLLEPVEMCVEPPDEVLKIIDRLKDSNLSLIHNSNLSKGSSKFETKEISEAKEKMEKELKIWDRKVSDVEKEVMKAKENCEKLRKQVSDLDKDDAGKTDRKQRENEMKKIADIYKLCTGSEAKNVDLTLMKAAIDYCIEDLLHEINKYPKKKIKEMLKMLEAEKKQSERKAEEALRAQRLKHRLQRALSPRFGERTKKKGSKV